VSRRTEREVVLLGASGLTNVGDWLTYVAIAALAATDSLPGPSLALVVLGQTLPRALLAPLAGWLVDRAERTRTYAAAEITRGLVALGMAYFALRNNLAFALALHALRGGLGAFSDTAARALVPSVVPADRVAPVNRDLGAVWSVAFVVGIAAGGALVGGAGAPVAFGLDALSFFLAALVVLALPRVWPSDPRSAHQAARAPAVPVVALMRGPLGLAHGAAFVLVAPSVGSARAAALGLSLVHGARALGNLLGARLGTRPRAALVATPLGLAGVCLSVMNATTSPLALVGAMLWGAGMGASYTYVTNRLHRDVPREALGRALSRDALVFTLAWAAGACGAGLSGGSRAAALVALSALVLAAHLVVTRLGRTRGEGP